MNQPVFKEFSLQDNELHFQVASGFGNPFASFADEQKQSRNWLMESEGWKRNEIFLMETLKTFGLVWNTQACDRENELLQKNIQTFSTYLHWQNSNDCAQHQIVIWRQVSVCISHWKTNQWFKIWLHKSYQEIPW